ncbi:hypothetical protein ABFW14_06655 [Mycolicibacterium fortuitum]|uniref:hypothetical protein n=1 Tax=Mycolicibacterium fortuitum TaxID=1766 RepID=UPI0007EC4D6A|nr:hypothetical protein [Mycolicibacterium fortuitum]OBK05199.1 hypothetical protein A5637_10460 [Mycolicibacterium fortuitum]
MTSESSSWQKNFTMQIGRLAASAEVQQAYLRKLGVDADELALEFDSLYVPDRLSLSETQTSYARRIDKIFQELSTGPDSGQWSYDGLQSDPRWAEVRAVASQFFTSLEPEKRGAL